ncbi:cupin domain-containing protein [Aquimarina sediminis]|uniref:cupin domain-containing protein n=1 Tax=Aquimarina sediminis TaxID=2070536 RepID=UPI000CA085E9|nr:cupin domain-containing protein [Aquimarina sediminis]
MKAVLIICGILISYTGLMAQNTMAMDSIQPDQEYENLLVKKIYSDKHTSTFIVWLKKGIKAHKHLKHTEQVFVLEGKASLILDNKKIIVQKGDWITIPEKTVHAVKVLSEIPMKVISIQSPEFEGKDREFVE